MRIEDSIDIAAPPERIWDLTVDVEAWPRHTASITSVERLDDGPLRIGSTAKIKQPGQGAKTWTVDTLEQGHRFAWSTRALGARMTGTHVVDAQPSGTRNTLRIDIVGPLAPLLGPLVARPIRKALRMENEGFKRAAERAA